MAAARISSNEEDKWLQRNDVTVDIVNAVGSALLGLTLHCAQCHDHKFDPISIRDYYRLHAYFARGMPVNVQLRGLGEQPHVRSLVYEPALLLKRTLYERAQRRWYEQQLAKLNPSERIAIETPLDRRTAAEELLARKAALRLQPSTDAVERNIDEPDRKLYDELKKRVTELEKTLPPYPQTFAFYSPVTSPHRCNVLPSVGFYPLPYDPDELARIKSYVMPRGEVHRIGEAVEPGVPAVLEHTKISQIRASSESSPRRGTRSEFADWLTNRRNPLVARVWVNRIWQYHFGRGLVATPDDFGLRGASPTHPELLDWLASELMDSGWSTRHVQRLILHSATYRQSTTAAHSALQCDPDNQFLTRWSARRIEAEALHDALLAVSGRLDATVGGPSVPLEQRESSLRRNLYLVQSRGRPTDVQSLFDGPNECAASIARRDVSTSPLQSLYLLNSDFVVQRASDLSSAIACRQPGDRAKQITAAFARVLLRAPTDDERRAAEDLWDASPSGSALERLCQTLVNLNEFVYLE